MKNDKASASPSAAIIEKELAQKIATYCSATDGTLIHQAYLFADAAHRGQQRKSGEPYIVHPLAVAQTLADLHLDAVTVAAGLLHDVSEDTETTLDEVNKQFGGEITQLVDGVTKLSQIRLKKSWREVYRNTVRHRGGNNFEAFDRHVETLQKMFVAMS